MEPNRSKFKLWILVVLLLAGGCLWLVRFVRLQMASQPAPTSSRQQIPPPSVLELPPTAPVPSYPHPIFSRINPEPIPSENADSKKAQEKKHSRSKRRIPTKWEIINRYRQVIELDFKYLEIAVESDRDGYTNQAIRYYKKYIDIAPMGPYANQVRARLQQLESSR